jgi:hypothetical protein
MNSKWWLTFGSWSNTNKQTGSEIRHGKYLENRTTKMMFGDTENYNKHQHKK